MAKRIGIADTTFATYDMAKTAVQAINDSGEQVIIVRYTVPGIKDLPVAAKKLVEEENCDIALALGMVGRDPIDAQCAHEASNGIITAQLMSNKHILGVFVHMTEAKDDADLRELCRDRTVKHALNALALLIGKDALRPFAGQGRRQGRDHVGPIPE